MSFLKYYFYYVIIYLILIGVALSNSGNNKKFVPNENTTEQKLRTTIKKVLKIKRIRKCMC